MWFLEHGYGKDQCTDQAFEDEALELYGCTTPFGLHKDKICDISESALKVNHMFRKWYNHQIQAESGCKKPCSYVTLRASTVWEREKIYKTQVQVVIYFKENIKVTKAYHVYSGLSLIAEIGGYVGLFLGVSINQVTNLFDVLFNAFRKQY